MNPKLVDKLLTELNPLRMDYRQIKESMKIDDDHLTELLVFCQTLELISFNLNESGFPGLPIPPDYNLTEKGMSIILKGGYQKHLQENELREQEQNELNAKNLEIAKKTLENMDSNRRMTFIGGITGLIGGVSGLIALYFQINSEPKLSTQQPKEILPQSKSVLIEDSLYEDFLEPSDLPLLDSSSLNKP